MEISYHHATRRAVFRVCRDRPDGSGPTCRLAIARFEPGIATVVPQPLGRNTSVYAAPQFSPDGSALYLTRRGVAPLGGRWFDGASEIVRLDLATRRERVIRSGHGLNFVQAVVEGPDDSDHLLLSGLGAPAGLGPVREPPRTARYDGVRDNLTIGPPIANVYGGSVGLALASCGFANRVWTNAFGAPPRQVYAATRLDEAARGEARLFETFAPAVAHLAGSSMCGGAAAHAQAAAAAIDSRPAYANRRFPSLSTEPEHVLVRFEGRPFPFFPDAADPFGDFHLAWDLRGGALAVPLHPLVDGRVRY